MKKEVTNLLDYLRGIVREICKEEQISYTNLSKDWIIKLEKNEKKAFIVGTKFSINSDTASRIASDKYATYEVLTKVGIPVIEHQMVFHPKYRSRIRVRFKKQTRDVHIFKSTS